MTQIAQAEITTLRAAIRQILHLALPLALAQILTVSIMTTDIWMMGQLGAKELAAGSLAIRLYQPFYFFSLGMLTIVGPLIAQGLGSGDEKQVRRSFRQGLVIALGLGFLFAIPVWHGEVILPSLGQDPELVNFARHYFWISALSLPILNIFIILRVFVVAHGRPRTQMQAVLLGLSCNFFLNFALSEGIGPIPALGITGVALATLVSYFLMIIYMGWIIQTRAPFKQFESFRRLWVMDWPLTMRQLRIGFPNAVLVVTETSMFSVASLMIGVFGVSALAASSVALQVATLAFMLPLGITQAIAISIGKAAGKKNAFEIRLLGRAAIISSIGFTLITSVTIYFGSDIMLRIFVSPEATDFEAVKSVAIGLLFMTAIFQIPDGLQAVLAGGLRGLNDTFWPAIIGFISFWVLGLGSAYIMAFWLEWGPTSVWVGITIGLTISTMGLYWRWQTRMSAIAKGGKILLK